MSSHEDITIALDRDQVRRYMVASTMGWWNSMEWWVIYSLDRPLKQRIRLAWSVVEHQIAMSVIALEANNL